MPLFQGIVAVSWEKEESLRKGAWRKERKVKSIGTSQVPPPASQSTPAFFLLFKT
jgi:hypothetical protein